MEIRHRAHHGPHHRSHSGASKPKAPDVLVEAVAPDIIVERVAPCFIVATQYEYLEAYSEITLEQYLFEVIRSEEAKRKR